MTKSRVITLLICSSPDTQRSRIIRINILIMCSWFEWHCRFHVSVGKLLVRGCLCCLTYLHVSLQCIFSFGVLAPSLTTKKTWISLKMSTFLFTILIMCSWLGTSWAVGDIAVSYVGGTDQVGDISPFCFGDIFPFCLSSTCLAILDVATFPPCA